MSRYLSCAETAKLVRKALKDAFPGVKFSVRSSVYSGGASIDVGWTDGPTSKEVEAVAKQYQGGDFDGMIDMKVSHTHFLMPDGSAALASTPGTEGSLGCIPREHHFKPHPEAERVKFGADFVFCNRTISAAFKARTAEAWQAMTADERCRLLCRDTGLLRHKEDDPDFPYYLAHTISLYRASA